MDAALSFEETFERERGRLRNFIRKRVADAADADDILQEVFYELLESTKPIEQVTAWLFRVASNRIIDLFRKQKRKPLSIDDVLPSFDDGPDAAYGRTLLVDELTSALEELPPEQRAVFIAHEIEGRSFKEISEASGVGVNTLLSRKHYAVLHLRRRLQEIYEEFR
jgi:RNA polymerase sigma factor (sigma-70 family)